MTPAQLATNIRFKTKTNSTTFTDANMLPLVNDFKNEISSMIAERNQGYFAVPATEDLVADQREYAFPSDMLNNLLKVECKFDSSDARFPLKALKDYRRSETESEITNQFQNVEGEAFYVIRRRAIFILSGTITAVTDGLRIWYVQYPSDLANLTDTTDMSIDPSTTTAGFPKQFHELLARRVAMEYKQSGTKPIPLNTLERNYPNDLEKQLAAISHIDHGLEIIGELPPPEDLGNDGFDY